MDPLRVAVCGAGSFGRNHLRVYRELQAANSGVTLAAAVEPHPERAAETAQIYSIPVFPSVAALLAAGLNIHAASVAVPTVHHHSVALELLEAGIDLLVEKPIASTLVEADSLIAAAARHKRILQPGHLERFNPAITAVESRLRKPMFFEAHRLSIFTPRALDVDVVLDLMIHDLDIVLRFANSPVSEVRAVGLPILSPKTDIANVRVEFESGCVANFTASRVSTERVRKLRFFEPARYVSIDYARQDLLVIEVDPKVAAAALAALNARQLLAAGDFTTAATEPHPSAGLTFQKPGVKPGEPLRLEIESFLASVRSRLAPRVTAQHGRDALALALEIQSAIAAHASKLAAL